MRRLIGFAAISGLGLGIDFAIFLLLVAAGLPPFWANAVSGTFAVSFVYFASLRSIFSYQGNFLLALFTVYLLYQVAGVTAASLAVAFLAEQQIAPALAKVIILPVTFSANYLFMSLLTRRGRARIMETCPATEQRSAGTQPNTRSGNKATGFADGR